MARKVFLGVGDITHQDLMEVLKPDHGFDLVLNLTSRLEVHYLGTSDGLELECKHGESVGSLHELVARHAGDLLFVKSREVMPDALPGARVLVGDADVGQWLHDIRVTLDSRLTLIHAVYGTPERSADVTNDIWTALQTPGRYPVSNHFFGCDPHYGVGKMVSIHYELDGVGLNLELWEGDYFLVA